MGVKLKELVIRRKIDYSSLKKKIIAVDAPNIIFSFINYVYKNTGQSSQKLMTDRTQRVISHLYGLLYRINFFYSRSILPVFCFDGRESDLKRIVTKDYLKDFRFTKQMYENALKGGNTKLARNITLSKEFLWSNIILESKTLLNALGVPCISSPASAESQCAHLAKNRIAHYA
ncbi:MAG: hypothetical protein EU539_14105, partial [Promethearchaeota archaeon]